jgi:hypothetical protein
VIFLVYYYGLKKLTIVILIFCFSKGKTKYLEEQELLENAEAGIVIPVIKIFKGEM